MITRYIQPLDQSIIHCRKCTYKKWTVMNCGKQKRMFLLLRLGNGIASNVSAGVGPLSTRRTWINDWKELQWQVDFKSE
jgi:hypothetical protein